MRVLLLGSGPSVTACRDWPRAPWDMIVAINNAWAVRPDWDVSIFPEDFPEDRRPAAGEGRRLVGADDFVPANNAFGGIVHAGATMAFTATYWALHALRPRLIGYLGCDMTYDGARTHFYGRGTADPLRADITLRSLEAKSCRAEALAAGQGCALVNLSAGRSRLTFPRARPDTLPIVPRHPDQRAVAEAVRAENAAGYLVEDGRYWLHPERFDVQVIDRIDGLWRAAWSAASAAA